jgi:hypothetical protein
MKLAILSALVASAAAFVPASQTASSTALSAKAAKAKSAFAGELGAQIPVRTLLMMRKSNRWFIPISLVLTTTLTSLMFVFLLISN